MKNEPGTDFECVRECVNVVLFKFSADGCVGAWEGETEWLVGWVGARAKASGWVGLWFVGRAGL